MSTVSFIVDGIPKGQPRPRAFSFNGKARVYNPGTAEGWKSAVALASMRVRPATPLDCPVSVRMMLRMPRPKRLCRAKDPAWELPHTAKPDVDNAAKAILDAMTETGWWRDDACVSELQVEKNYAAKAGRPGAVISVSWEA